MTFSYRSWGIQYRDTIFASFKVYKQYRTTITYMALLVEASGNSFCRLGLLHSVIKISYHILNFVKDVMHHTQ